METTLDILNEITRQNPVSLKNFLNDNFNCSDRGHAFEVLIDIIQRTHFIKDLENYTPVYGSFGNKKFNGVQEKKIICFLEEKFNNGNQQGAIDLVLKSDGKKEIIAFSFKFFDNEDPKSFDTYDITKMFGAPEKDLEKEFSGYNISFGIITYCEKEKLLKKLEKTKTKNSEKVKFILTKEDLEIYFENFKNFLRGCFNIKKSVVSKSNEKVNSIQLRFYQEYAYNTILNIFKNYDTALLGAIPRFGKTFVFGKLATNYKNVLYLSSVVSNIKEDLTNFITEQSDFEEYKKFIYTPLDEVKLDASKNIVITSIQSSTKHISKLPKFDLIICDESHIGSSTDNFRQILKAVSKNNTKLLLVTATFKKSVLSYELVEDQCFFFGVEKVAQIKDKRPEIILDIEKCLNRKLTNSEIEELKYPKMNCYNINLNVCYENKIKELLKNNECNIFSNIWKCDEQTFTDQGKAQIINIFDTIFKKASDELNGNHIQLTKLYNELKLTNFKNKLVIVSVEGGKGEMLARNVCKNAVSLCNERYDLNLYKFMEVPEKEPKKTIHYALEENKTLVVFTYRKLQTAITLKTCVGIIFLDDSKSEDALFQRLYRPMTWTKGKDNVFVLDYNFNRITGIILEYGFQTKQFTNLDGAKKYLQLIDTLVSFKQNDTNISRDEYFTEIINDYISNISSDELSNLIIESTEFKQDIAKMFYKGFEVKDSILRKEMKKRIELENKKMKDTKENEKHENKDHTEEQLKEQIILENLMKLYKKMINHVLHACIILSNSHDINNVINEIDFDFINKFCNDNYSFDLQKSQFEEQIREYNPELISKLILRIKKEMESSSPRQIYELVSKYLRPNETQKKKNGEVFTPLELVKEMLSHLPEHVWKNKDLKWLDPCVGIGNFPIVIYEMLMNGLKETIPNEHTRSEHIKNNMIYSGDLCPVNVALCKKITGLKNVVVADFLDPETFKGTSFDIVVGNPPYQKPSVNNKAVGGRGLWEDFVKISLDKLNKGGLLSFVHPCGWRRPNDKTGTIMKQHEFIHLQPRTKPFQNVGVWVDWYVLRKNNRGQYKTLPLIPNDIKSINIIKKILEYPCEKICFRRESGFTTMKKHVKRDYSCDYRYKIHHTNNQVLFSSKEPEILKLKKVMYSDSGNYKPFYDEGEFGATENTFHILVKNKKDGLYLTNYLNSKLINWYVEQNKIGNFRNEFKTLNNLPYIKNLKNFKEDLYTTLKLTREEICIIENSA